MIQPEPPILVTTFATLEDAHAALALLNAAGIPSSIEVGMDEGGSVVKSEGHARHVALFVPMSRMHEARAAILPLREARGAARP